MSLLFFLKPHYGGGGDGGGSSGGQIHVYDNRTYERVVKKVRRKQITELTHPFFRDNPDLIEVANEALLEGIELDEILLLFMMVER